MLSTLTFHRCNGLNDAAHLAPFHRKQYILRRVIPGYYLQFHAEDVLEKHGRRRDSLTGTHGANDEFALEKLLRPREARVRRNNQNAMRNLGAPKPLEFARIEPDSGKLENSSIRDVPGYHPDDRSVAGRDIEEVVSRNNMTGSGHVLYN